MKLDEIGVWSEIKLDIIREYADAFTKIMRKQDWCRGYAYVDGFAGAGIHISRRTGQFIPGSPLNALELENPFTEYHFIDIDKVKAEALEILSREKPNIKIYPEDCNSALSKEIFPSLRYETRKRALCILDPYGLHLNWETIMDAAKLRTTEIFLNFPVMDMNRNVLHKDLLSADPDQIERMNRFCGSEEWQDMLYEEDKQLGLFGDTYRIKVVDSNIKLGLWFSRERLQKAAGFKFVPEPVLMRNSKGGPLFFLFFASHNETGKNIVTDIFNKYRKYL
ncbi:MAG: three-Cys-motif partner protein TcmP [Thermodesulfobacteriota bacterium]|nr:three-Cys-motif partner protein TcmP [Thermodesulfobacteriota bacterium]